MKVLYAALAWYHIPVPNISCFCSLELSRRIWPDLSSHSLSVLAAEFGIQYNAHNALADAETCGKIIALCAKNNGKNAPPVSKVLKKAGVGIKLFPNQDKKTWMKGRTDIYSPSFGQVIWYGISGVAKKYGLIYYEIMPELSRFLGISILMYFDDHNPPHFHVKYNDHRALISIEDLGILEGRLPARVLGLVMEWAELHKNELMKDWDMVKTTGQYFKIDPLVQGGKMIWVVKAELRDGYRVYVEFNDGVSGVIDFYEKLRNDHRDIIRELLDLEKFKTVKTGLDTICWDNGVDFAPEYLYEQIVRKRAA